MTTEGERIDNTGEPAEESNEVDQGDTAEDAAAFSSARKVFTD